MYLGKYKRWKHAGLQQADVAKGKGEGVCVLCLSEALAGLPASPDGTTQDPCELLSFLSESEEPAKRKTLIGKRTSPQGLDN